MEHSLPIRTLLPPYWCKPQLSLVTLFQHELFLLLSMSYVVSGVVVHVVYLLYEELTVIVHEDL